jgi:hypothetical protein
MSEGLIRLRLDNGELTLNSLGSFSNHNGGSNNLKIGNNIATGTSNNNIILGDANNIGSANINNLFIGNNYNVIINNNNSLVIGTNTNISNNTNLQLFGRNNTLTNTNDLFIVSNSNNKAFQVNKSNGEVRFNDNTGLKGQFLTSDGPNFPPY